MAMSATKATGEEKRGEGGGTRKGPFPKWEGRHTLFVSRWHSFVSEAALALQSQSDCGNPATTAFIMCVPLPLLTLLSNKGLSRFC